MYLCVCLFRYLYMYILTYAIIYIYIYILFHILPFLFTDDIFVHISIQIYIVEGTWSRTCATKATALISATVFASTTIFGSATAYLGRAAYTNTGKEKPPAALHESCPRRRVFQTENMYKKITIYICMII